MFEHILKRIGAAAIKGITKEADRIASEFQEAYLQKEEPGIVDSELICSHYGCIEPGIQSKNGKVYCATHKP